MMKSWHKLGLALAITSVILSVLLLKDILIAIITFVIIFGAYLISLFRSKKN